MGRQLCVWKFFSCLFALGRWEYCCALMMLIPLNASGNSDSFNRNSGQCLLQTSIRSKMIKCVLFHIYIYMQDFMNLLPSAKVNIGLWGLKAFMSRIDVRWVNNRNKKVKVLLSCLEQKDVWIWLVSWTVLNFINRVSSSTHNSLRWANAPTFSQLERIMRCNDFRGQKNKSYANERALSVQKQDGTQTSNKANHLKC